jgi:acyl-coenzyme A thioesterase PaaI-like protein
VDSQASDAMTKTHTHTVTWEEATYPPEWMQLSGLERLQKALAAGIPRAPIAALIDMKLVSVEAGVAHFDAWPGPQHVNPIGIVHGGFAATLMDAACWTAGLSYTRAIMATSPEVKCEARVIHRGGRTVLTEAKVFDKDAKILAHATSTLLVLKP